MLLTAAPYVFSTKSNFLGVKMNILINASLPGCGKTYILTKIFKDYLPKSNEHCVFLCKTNKALDNAKSMLKGEPLQSNKTFRTVDQFKENWKIIPDDNGNERLVHLKSTPHISRCYYTLFIDEVSMVSDYELKDLLDNFIVGNIIAAGDLSQHSPIPSTFYEKTVNGLNSYIDDGSVINLQWDNVYTLNTPFRFKDENLVKVLNVLKTKDLITAEFLESNFTFVNEFTMQPTDLHICYTNEEVDRTNNMYEDVDKVTRYILNRKWRFNFCTVQNGQFVDKEYYNILKSEVEETKMFSSAMAVTSHKLQGWTANISNDIYIHFDDFRKCVEPTTVMRGLWVALTRAPVLSQVKFFGITPQEAANLINQNIKSDWLKTLNGVNKTQDEAYDEVIAALNNQEFDFKSDPRYIEWIAEYGKAHSVTHKQHKQHYCSVSSKLNKEEVEAFNAEHSLRETAKHFNVSTTTITKLLKAN